MQASKPRGGTNSRSRPPVTLGADGRRGQEATGRVPGRNNDSPPRCASLMMIGRLYRIERKVPYPAAALPDLHHPARPVVFFLPHQSTHHFGSELARSRHSLDGIVPAHATSDGQTRDLPGSDAIPFARDVAFKLLKSIPHAIAVYASQPLSPVATQHSLPSGRYSLLGLPRAGSHQRGGRSQRSR